VNNGKSNKILTVKSKYAYNTVTGLNKRIKRVQIGDLERYQFEDGPVINNINIEDINDLFSIYISEDVPGTTFSRLFKKKLTITVQPSCLAP
jgi:hypothetical protein